MANTVIVGAQWGDEGKGKIIDFLTQDTDYIVRFQGGNNAGHTVVIKDEEFILHLIPSGILRKGKTCVIGNGVVVDPQALVNEIDYLKKRGIDINHNLLISDQVHIIFPYHKRLDKLREKKAKIGTTGRGIGPCYADKIARTGIRLVDMLDEEVFAKKLKANLNQKNHLINKVYKAKERFSFKKIFSEYKKYGKRIKKYTCSSTWVLNEAIAKGKSILFEGAQGALLDIDFGTYPYVTSSNTSSGGASTGTGVSPTKIDKVIGVVKAYTTRVGEGPFPTQFPPLMMDKIQKKGKEFGATTGRPRRCGWFDAVIASYSSLVNGLSEVAVTKLDVLDEIDPIKICTAYRYKNKIYKRFSSNIERLWECEPIYEEHPGWLEDTTSARSFKELPLNARRYLKRLEEFLNAKVTIVSVGSRRSQTFRT